MSGFVIIVLFVLAGIGAIGAAMGLGVQGTRKKFARLGQISGRTKAEIIEAVGPPNSISNLAGGKTLLQWQHISSSGGYHIALRFDAAGVCEGVTHEHSNQR